MGSYCIGSNVLISHGGSDESTAHSHTLTVSAFLHREDGTFEPFSLMARRLDDYLGRYGGKYLNALPEFREDSSIEHITDVFFSGLSHYLRSDGVVLERIEVGETPLRICAVGLESSSGPAPSKEVEP